MTDEDYKYITTSDHYIEIPEYNLKAVHGGFFPDSATETQPMKCIIRLRYIIPGTHKIFRPGEQPEKAVFWGDVFPGPEHAIFGHDHAVEIREFGYATGIDTGCVFGGKLTALAYLPDKKIETIQVKAKKSYWREADSYE